MGTTRRAATRVAEAMLALALVLVFFLGFMAITSFSLPQGTSLQEMMFNPRWAAFPTRAGGLDLRLAQEAPEAGTFVATLIRTRRTVKDKRSGAIAWNSAHSGLPLENRHSVQTYGRSGADIEFGENNEISLDQNSLIIIRSLEQDRQTSRKRASLLLLGGSLRGGTTGDSGTSMPLEFVTAGGSALQVPATARSTDYKITINPDNTSTFSVFAGEASVVSGGKSVRLGPNQWITVAGSSAPGLPANLPGRPDVIAPTNDSVVFYRDSPSPVEFGWQADGATEAYRLLIGRDPEFEDLVYEGTLDAAEFVHGNLPNGQYYWKVAGVSGWAEGPHSEPHRLNIVRDVDPPLLRVAFPSDAVERDVLLLRGATEPGAEVFVGDASVPTDASGAFEYAMSLRRGLNVVVVEAVDAAGNIAYESNLVNVKY